LAPADEPSLRHQIGAQARSVSSPDRTQAGGSRFKAALMKRMLIRVSELDK
jgi:hypothetical protein